MGNQKEPSKNELELYPDAWDRFRQAVHVMAKAGPQHRISGVTVNSSQKISAPKHLAAINSKERPASKGRVRKGKFRA